MTLAIKCDKCGKFEEALEYTGISFGYAEIGVPRETTICLNCTELLKDWVRKNE